MSDLPKTPLHAMSLSRGAKMVEFAGYEMPVSFPEGVLKEHLHTRAAAGLFDVSHMGQIALRPKSGGVAQVAESLERLIPMNVIGLAADRQRYGLFTNASGGILDDLMFANRGDHLFLIVNAATKAADLAHLEAELGDLCEVEPLERGLIALQGPSAERVLSSLNADAGNMRFMDVWPLNLRGVPAIVSRSGYSGEDGYEISALSAHVVDLAGWLLEKEGVALVGLGARDSLRLEAGLCLYGHDIDETTTPVEAGLEWAIQPARRAGGARTGGFPGADVILDQIAEGAKRRRVGLLPEGRAPMREGTELFAEEGGAPVGRITSGGFSPSLGAPVAMGYVPIDLAAPGTRLFGLLRGKMLPVTVAKLPFIEPRYKRA
jgi:aminomethyltransferase